MEKEVKRNARHPRDLILVEAIEETTKYVGGLETHSTVYVFRDTKEGTWFFADPANECAHKLETEEALNDFLRELRV